MELLVQSTKEWRDFCTHQHDVVCNQRYADVLPYSFHLKAAFAQGNEFMHLLTDEEEALATLALWGHDIIEDARMTWNDIRTEISEIFSYVGDKKIFSTRVADIIYCVTDEKGINRAGRKNEKYYKELNANEIAIFVKLSNIAANTLFSKLTGSSMYRKYKKEFPKLKEKIYVERFKEFFDYIENL